MADTDLVPFQGPRIDPTTGKLDGPLIDYWIPANVTGGTPAQREAVTRSITGEGPDYCTGWDTAWLAGKQLPGLVSVKCESTLQIDQQKGGGYDGAKLVLRGYVPGPIEMSVLLWTLPQWRIWCEVMPSFWRLPGKSAKELHAIAKAKKISTEQASTFQSAVDIVHPGIQMLGIGQVIVRGISVPEPGPQSATRLIRLRLIEYREPTKAPTKVVSKKPGGTPIHDDQRVPEMEPPSKSGGGPDEHH